MQLKPQIFIEDHPQVRAASHGAFHNDAELVVDKEAHIEVHILQEWRPAGCQQLGAVTCCVRNGKDVSLPGLNMKL